MPIQLVGQVMAINDAEYESEMSISTFVCVASYLWLAVVNVNNKT